MNVFFTCKASCHTLIKPYSTLFNFKQNFFVGKNTLVILLQLYRLYVVHTENRKSKSKKKKMKYHEDRQRFSKGGRRRRNSDVYIISNEKSSRQKKR